MRWRDALNAAGAAPLWAATWLLRLLPPRWSSAFAAAVAGRIGAMLPVNRYGQENLARVFPERSVEERTRLLRAMWENLGRLAAEHSHAGSTSSAIAVQGVEILEAARDSGRSVVFVSAHLGNWELLPRVAEQHGLVYTGVYRQANNPFVERLIQRQRGQQSAAFIPKGKGGTRQLLKLAKAGQPLGMLIDQRLSEGIRVPFLGHDAATTTTPAELCLRFNALLIPAYACRTSDNSFTVVIESPLQRSDIPAECSTSEAGIRWLTERLNDHVGRWIRDYPEQWLWLHRRWR